MLVSERQGLREELRNNFILIAVLSIVIVAVISNLSINIFFSKYLREARERDDEKVLGYVQKVYGDYEGLTPDAIMSMVHYAFSESVTIVLKDEAGGVVWSSNSGDMMHCLDGTVVEESTLKFRSHPVDFMGSDIASVEVGRIKSIVGSVEDKRFIGAINLAFGLAVILSVLIALVTSSRVAGRFLKPIYSIRENIGLIDKGKYKALVPVDTNTHELYEMSKSIEELSLRLYQQEALRKRMTTDMAHELRTPLATLQSHIEAFMDGVWKTDMEKLSIVHGEVLHLTKLIKALSDLAIIENDEIKINKKTIDLSKLMKEIGERFEPLAAGKNIAIKYEIEDGIIMEGDMDHLERIFINVLSNSYKYTNEEGEIFLGLKKEGQRARAVIKDNGIGIPEGDLKLVFERFYRSDISRSRGTGGTGIGLTITKTLVEANGGNITIESQVGQGTSVICEFSVN